MKSALFFVSTLFCLLLSGSYNETLGQTGIDSLYLQWIEHEPPEYQIADSAENVFRIFFAGPEYKGKQTEVFAYYSNPALLRGRATQDKKYPGILLLHGGGGHAYIEWVKIWASKGFAALAIDLSGRDHTGERLTAAGPDQDTMHKFNQISQGLEHTWSYYSTASAILAHTMLRNFKEVDQDNTFLTGISWGAYLSCLVASFDNRFIATVPVYGCGFFESMAGPEKRLNDLAENDRQYWLQTLDPSGFLSNAKGNFFFINGNKDFFFNLLPWQKTLDLIPGNQKTACIIPDFQHNQHHGSSQAEIFEYILSFIDESHFLPKITRLSKESDWLRIQYESLVGIREAVFYYTPDEPDDKATWLQFKPELQNDTIQFDTGDLQYNCGFLLLTDHRRIQVSTELIFKGSDKQIHYK